MFGLSTVVLRWIGVALLVIATVFSIYYKGRLDERELFNRYKAEVKAAAMAQEEQAKRVEAKNQKLLEETKNAYNTKLATLRSYYGMRLNKGGSTVSGTPASAGGTAGYTADNLPPVATLAAQCAETTLTLYTLQNWVKDVYNNQ